jgi:hypothetical protein
MTLIYFLSLAPRLQLVLEPSLDLDARRSIDPEVLATLDLAVLATKVPPCEGCSEDDTYTGGEVDGEGQDVPGGVRVEIT